jgi:hypothetical protein
MFLVSWLVAEALVISTGLLIPASFVDRHRILFEMFEPHPEWGFHTRPNLQDFHVQWSETGVEASYSTDELGFRNVGRDYDAARIAFIGDSFTFGMWVDEGETFPSLLEQQLNTPILNLGQQSFYIEQYAMVTDWLLEHHHPDTIVVSIFPNDLTTEMTPDDFANFYERFGWNDYRAMPWNQRSIAYQLASRLNPPAPPPGIHNAVGPLGLTLFRVAGAHPDFIEADQVSHAAYVLSSIIEQANDHGIRTVVALLPSKESTYHLDYANLFDGDYLSNEEQGYQRLAASATAAGATVIDLTPTFREHANERLYFDIDAHFNATGHSLVASTLQPLLSHP